MNRLKALKSMMGEPMIGLKKRSEFEGASDEAKGMVSMMVTPEEKEMILARREGVDIDDDDDDVEVESERENIISELS